MAEFVLTVGLLLVGTSLYLVVQPRVMLTLIDQVLTTRWIFLAAVLRLMLGATLIASAQAVKFPEVITAIGWLVAFSGLVLVAVPPGVWDRLNDWLQSLPAVLLRTFTSIGVALGGFLLFVSLA